MIKRMLLKDFVQNKVVAVTLFVFITLASMLAAAAIGVIIELTSAVDTLFEKAITPHFVQMHSGELDESEIADFAKQNAGLIERWQTVELINLPGANIILGNNAESEAASVMENAFVKQNEHFDFLLDTENKTIRLRDGEVAVPLYHKQQYGLQLGDTVRLTKSGFDRTFTIAAFIRDAQMNPSIITSKRFLLSDNDWNDLRQNFNDIEWLIEFRLLGADRAGELENLYYAAGLPQTGPAVNYLLFKLMNSLTDGIVAAVVILVGIMLAAIAVLCLRFAIISSIEEDYREIGVMKAIGIRFSEIRKLYMIKYIAMAAVACVCGYALSFPMSGVLTANISLYMGSSEQSIWSVILPILGGVAMFGMVTGFCLLVLRRFKAISAVDAIRMGSSSAVSKSGRGIKLYKSKFPNVNILLGAKDVLERFKSYGLLCFVFVICAFLMTVPLNALNTVDSPDFLTYMGAGKSDIRIDLRQGGDMERLFDEIIIRLNNDADVAGYSGLVTSAFEAINADGENETIKVEIGDFSVFPLEYMRGAAPATENEIALSVLYAEDFAKNIGDTLPVIVNGDERPLTISGIFQDVTNGGRTAKAILPYDSDNILWYTINVNIQNASIIEIIEEYKTVFYPARVMGIDEYMSQTLGGAIRQLELAALFAALFAVGIAVLISAMFFKMLTAKDASQIAIMRSVGFKMSDIHVQYVTRALLVLFIGIVLGTLAAAFLSPMLTSLIIPGVTSVKVAAQPLTAYVLCPVALIVAVIVTLWFIGTSMKKASGFIMSAE